MCKWRKWVLGFGVSLDSLLVVSLLMNISSQVNVFLRGGDSEGWGGGLVGLDEGMVGYWPKGVLTRACMRDPVLGVLFFCCHKCHSGWGWKCFIIPKTMCRFIENNVSFYWKHRIVLLKTTCRFTENNVSFYWKHRIVLLKTSYRFVESDGLFWMGGRKVVLRIVFWGVFGVE